MAISKETQAKHTCPQCARTFTRTGHFNLHMRTHTGVKPYTCDHPGCEKRFSRADNLRRHALSHSESPRQFQCDRSDCDKSFKTQAHLRRHVALHERPTPFKCKVCDDSFAKRRVLAEHMAANHNGQLPYVCNEPGCDAAFLRPSLLKRHKIAVHTEKSFVCMDEACDELPPFTKFSELQRHMRREHPLEQSLACDACDKVFQTGHGLKRHRRIHETPLVDRLSFRCTYPLCGALYSSRSNLGTHIRSKHTEQGSFVCDTCSATFSLKSSLKRHVLNIHLSQTPSSTSTDHNDVDCQSLGREGQGSVDPHPTPKRARRDAIPDHNLLGDKRHNPSNPNQTNAYEQSSIPETQDIDRQPSPSLSRHDPKLTTASTD